MFGSSPKAPAFPATLTCEGGALPGTTKAPLPPRPQMAGALTAEGKRARRLYDDERWSEASLLLARVAAGETGDDLGNRQIADYQHAIALYRLGDAPAAADLFAEIARDRSHLRHGESLLWISKIAPSAPHITRALVFYTEDDVSKYNNAEQRETYWQLVYLLARERYERGLFIAAAQLFSRVDGGLKKYAQACYSRSAEAASRPPASPP